MEVAVRGKTGFREFKVLLGLVALKLEESLNNKGYGPDLFTLRDGAEPVWVIFRTEENDCYHLELGGGEEVKLFKQGYKNLTLLAENIENIDHLYVGDNLEKQAWLMNNIHSQYRDRCQGKIISMEVRKKNINS